MPNSSAPNSSTARSTTPGLAFMAIDPTCDFRMCTDKPESLPGHSRSGLATMHFGRKIYASAMLLDRRKRRLYGALEFLPPVRRADTSPVRISGRRLNHRSAKRRTWSPQKGVLARGLFARSGIELGMAVRNDGAVGRVGVTRVDLHRPDFACSADLPGGLVCIDGLKGSCRYRSK